MTRSRARGPVDKATSRKGILSLALAAGLGISALGLAINNTPILALGILVAIFSWRLVK